MKTLADESIRRVWRVFALVSAWIFSGVFGFQTIALSVHEATHWVHRAETKNVQIVDASSCAMCVTHELQTFFSSTLIDLDQRLVPQLVRTQENSSPFESPFASSVRARAPPSRLS